MTVGVSIGFRSHSGIGNKKVCSFSFLRVFTSKRSDIVRTELFLTIRAESVVNRLCSHAPGYPLNQERKEMIVKRTFFCCLVLMVAVSCTEEAEWGNDALLDDAGGIDIVSQSAAPESATIDGDHAEDGTLQTTASCPYSSVQARVQKNEQDPWKQNMWVLIGESFRVGAFKNGWGLFVDCCATIAVTTPTGGVYYPANGSYVSASVAGTYRIDVTCGTLSDYAFVTVYYDEPGATGCTWYGPQASNVYHLIGRPDGSDWYASVGLDSSGFLSYGPYDTKWGVGSHVAGWFLLIDNNSADNGVVATIDVVTNYGQRLLARREIRRQKFTAPYLLQLFNLNFENPNFEPTEVRIYWHDIAYIKHGGSYICKSE